MLNKRITAAAGAQAGQRVPDGESAPIWEPARRDSAEHFFQIERAALHSYGPDPHSRRVLAVSQDASSNECSICHGAFNFFSNRRHHCRNWHVIFPGVVIFLLAYVMCIFVVHALSHTPTQRTWRTSGALVCGNCSPFEWRLPNIDKYKLQRVCNPCYQTLKSSYVRGETGTPALSSKREGAANARAPAQVSASDRRAVFVPPTAPAWGEVASPPPPPIPAKPKHLFQDDPMKSDGGTARHIKRAGPAAGAQGDVAAADGRRDSRRISKEGLRLFQGALTNASGARTRDDGPPVGPPPVPPKPAVARRPAPKRPPQQVPPKVPPKPGTAPRGRAMLPPRASRGSVKALAAKFDSHAYVGSR